MAGGVDVKTAQSRLGHSSSRLTLEIYARANGEADRRVADVVGDWFRPRDVRPRDGRAIEPDSKSD